MKEQGKTKSILVEIGAGELIDKITILQIKLERIKDRAKRSNVQHELETLQAARCRSIGEDQTITDLEQRLKAVNNALWDIEDHIRECEGKQDFGPAFIELARSVYRQNDRRAALKKEINLLTDSAIIEEKSYTDYCNTTPAPPADA